MGGEEGPKLRQFSGGGSCIRRRILLNRNRRAVSQTNHLSAGPYAERTDFSDLGSTLGILHSFSPCSYHVFPSFSVRKSEGLEGCRGAQSLSFATTPQVLSMFRNNVATTSMQFKIQLHELFFSFLFEVMVRYCGFSEPS